jgi:hypothetical protein
MALNCVLGKNREKERRQGICLVLSLLERTGEVDGKYHAVRESGQIVDDDVDALNLVLIQLEALVHELV